MIGIVLTNILYVAFLIYILHGTYKFRTTNILYNGIGTFCFLCISNAFVLNSEAHLTVMGTTILNSLYLYYLYKVDFFAIVIILLAHCLISASEFLSGYILGFVVSENDMRIVGSVNHVLGLVLSLIFFLIFSVFLKKTCSYLKGFGTLRYREAVFILPFITYILILSVPDYFSFLINDRSLVLSLVCLVISNFIMLYFYAHSIKAIQLDSKVRTMEQKIDYLNQEYTNNFNYLHNLMHDFSKLYTMFEKEYNQEAKEFVYSMGEKVSQEFNLICSNSIALNTVLNTKRNDILSNDIKVSQTVLCEINEIEQSDQISIFLYLFEIGYARCHESCKFIDFIVKEINSHKVIQMICPRGLSTFKGNEDLNEIFKKYNIQVSSILDKEIEKIMLLVI